MHSASSGIEGIGYKFFNRLVRARVEAFREQFDNFVADTDLNAIGLIAYSREIRCFGHGSVPSKRDMMDSESAALQGLNAARLPMFRAASAPLVNERCWPNGGTGKGRGPSSFAFMLACPTTALTIEKSWPFDRIEFKNAQTSVGNKRGPSKGERVKCGAATAGNGASHNPALSANSFLFARLSTMSPRRRSCFLIPMPGDTTCFRAAQSELPLHARASILQRWCAPL